MILTTQKFNFSFIKSYIEKKTSKFQVYYPSVDLKGRKGGMCLLICKTIIFFQMLKAFQGDPENITSEIEVTASKCLKMTT